MLVMYLLRSAISTFYFVLNRFISALNLICQSHLSLITLYDNGSLLLDILHIISCKEGTLHLEGPKVREARYGE